MLKVFIQCFKVCLFNNIVIFLRDNGIEKFEQFIYFTSACFEKTIDFSLKSEMFYFN